MIFTAAFWKGAAERAIKTFAQALAALIAANGIGIVDVDWLNVLSIAALSAVASILTSIGNPGFVAGPPDAIVSHGEHSANKPYGDGEGLFK